jgi:hypothetical protein
MPAAMISSRGAVGDCEAIEEARLETQKHPTMSVGDCLLVDGIGVWMLSR